MFHDLLLWFAEGCSLRRSNASGYWRRCFDRCFSHVHCSTTSFERWKIAMQICKPKSGSVFTPNVETYKTEVTDAELGRIQRSWPATGSKLKFKKISEAGMYLVWKVGR